MRRLILLAAMVLLMTACTSSAPNQQGGLNQASSQQEEATPDIEGYQELAPKVYLSDKIDLNYETSLSQYRSSRGNEEAVLQEMKNWLGKTATDEVVTEDHSQFHRVKYEDIRADITVNNNGTWIDVRSGKYKNLRSLYWNFFQDSLAGQVSISNFNETLSFSREEALEKVKSFIKRFDLKFEDYDYVIASASKQSLEAYLPYLKESRLKENEDVERYEGSAEDVCAITVHPKISGHRIIDANTQFGNIDGLNWTNGSHFEFLFAQGEMIEANIPGVFPLEKEEDEALSIRYRQVADSLKEKYENTIIDHPVYIEDMQVTYAPLPYHQEEGNLYQERIYQPLVKVTMREEGNDYSIYINPLTWKEVR